MGVGVAGRTGGGGMPAEQLTWTVGRSRTLLGEGGGHGSRRGPGRRARRRRTRRLRRQPAQASDRKFERARVGRGGAGRRCARRGDPVTAGDDHPAAAGVLRLDRLSGHGYRGSRSIHEGHDDGSAGGDQRPLCAHRPCLGTSLAAGPAARSARTASRRRWPRPFGGTRRAGTHAPQVLLPHSAQPDAQRGSAAPCGHTVLGARAESCRRGSPGGPRCPAPRPEGRDAGRELGAGVDARQDRGHCAVPWTPGRDARLRPDGRRPDDQAGEPLPGKRGDLPAHPSGRGDRLRHRVRRAARAAGRHVDHHAAHRSRVGLVGGAAVAHRRQDPGGAGNGRAGSGSRRGDDAGATDPADPGGWTRSRPGGVTGVGVAGRDSASKPGPPTPTERRATVRTWSAPRRTHRSRWWTGRSWRRAST